MKDRVVFGFLVLPCLHLLLCCLFCVYFLLLLLHNILTYTIIYTQSRIDLNRELERKEDARLARDQAALTAQLQEELRRDKSLDTKAAQQQKNLFDEQIVGRGEQSQESNNNLFRAPSPILDMHQRNKNLFRPSSSSIELDNNDNDNDSSEAFHPPRSPALPAQRKNQLFQAPSPVLERDQSGNTHNKQHLFNSASPPSSPMGNQNGRQHDRQQDSRSNKMSRERVRQTSSPNQRHHQQSPVSEFFTYR